MSKLYWGVDSLFPADTTANTQLKKTIFEIVEEEERIPDFWGRYIIGKPEHILTKRETKFLLDKGCRILPIYNGISKITVKTRANGVKQAQDAILRANKLSIPKWTYIFANLEWNFYPTKDWFVGWWETMFNSHYGGAGGLYCNPAGHNVGFLKNYRNAMNEVTDSLSIPNIRYFCPTFSSGPPKGCNANRKTIKWNPYEPVFNPGSTQLWQYAIDCHKVQGRWGAYDKVLATEKGFNRLWR